MFVLTRNKTRVMSRTLVHRYRDGRGGTWQLADSHLTSVAEVVASLASIRDPAALPPGIEVLRGREHKMVLRVANPGAEPRSFVVKIFRWHRLFRGFRYDFIGYNRFGLGEAANLAMAANRGLNVPKIYGYGCKRGFCGLVNMSTVILEDLAHCTPVGQLLEENQNDQGRCAAILSWVVPLFASMFRTCCHHIDVNPGAILVDRTGGHATFLIDFEHARFSGKSNAEVLMFEAGHFALGCRQWVDPHRMERWLGQLLDAVGIRETEARANLAKRFEHYASASLSRKQRLRIS